MRKSASQIDPGLRIVLSGIVLLLPKCDLFEFSLGLAAKQTKHGRAQRTAMGRAATAAIGHSWTFDSTPGSVQMDVIGAVLTWSEDVNMNMDNA